MRHGWDWWEAFWRYMKKEGAGIKVNNVGAWLSEKRKEFEEYTRKTPRWWEPQSSP